MNGILLKTITIGGTKGEWIEIMLPMREVIYANNLIRLYFAQGGMEIDFIEISKI